MGVMCNSVNLIVLLSVLSILHGAHLSGGCGAAIKSGTYTIVHNGLNRVYGLAIPNKYDVNVPSPLVVAFHGWGEDETAYLADSTVSGEADKRGYVLVSPRGLGSESPDKSYNSWTFPGSSTGVDGTSAAATCDPKSTHDYTYKSCSSIANNTCSWTHCQDDDVAFTVALVEEVKQKLCIDIERIFATGGSNGGMFTWHLGQNPRTASTFKAIAPLIGLPHRAYLDAPGKSGQLPVLLITGTKDTTVPPGEWEDTAFTTTGGSDRYYYTGATAITQVWALAHGCGIDNNATTYLSGYSQVECRTYCATGATGWPLVTDCRAPMGHMYLFSWSFKLVMDFFDAFSA